MLEGLCIPEREPDFFMEQYEDPFILEKSCDQEKVIKVKSNTSAVMIRFIVLKI